MTFAVEFTESALKDCRRLPRRKLAQIETTVREEIAVNPQTAGYKLVGELKGYYSIHVAEYRIMYQIKAAEKKVIIYRIRHRKDIYR